MYYFTCYFITSQMNSRRVVTIFLSICIFSKYSMKIKRTFKMKIYVNEKVVNILQHIIYTSKYPRTLRKWQVLLTTKMNTRKSVIPRTKEMGSFKLIYQLFLFGKHICDKENTLTQKPTFSQKNIYCNAKFNFKRHCIKIFHIHGIYLVGYE